MHREEEVRYDPQTGERIVTTTHVEHPAEPVRVERIVEKPTIIKKRAGFGTWLGGAIVGAVVLAGAYAYFAHREGSYTAAGAVVDQKVAEAQQATNNAAENAGDAAKQAGDNVERATDNAAAGN